MSHQHFPPGWDADRVQRLIAHYETQDENEQLVEDEAAQEQPNETTVVVPVEFMPVIRQMLAHRGGV